MRPLFLLAAAAAVLASATAIPRAAQEPAPAAKPAPITSEISTLAWLSGSWLAVEGDTRAEENWTVPAGGTMLATAREVRGKKTAFFEFLRIEEREGKLVYLAMPKARAATAFTLTKQGEKDATFENPEHDFPKRIVYRLEGDDVLVTRIDAGDGDEKQASEARYKRVR